ncbi:hypothetical protein PENTCL1PPCAC_20473, partial [Pristionchus entomophagus]
MLQGYILVSPAGPLADRLIEKLNHPLRYADFFASLFPQYAEIALALQDAVNLSDLPKAATVIFKLWQVSVLSDELEKAAQTAFAPSSDPSSLGAVLKNLAEDVDEALKCLLIDRIVPVANETIMEKVAVCLQKTQQYWSGKLNETTSSTTSAVPEVVTYKIRHLQSMVDGTGGSQADSSSNMRARDAPFIDLKYTTFGFSFLQEAVETALREMMAEDGNIDSIDDVGAYSQQEPYPCYSVDTRYRFDVTIFLSMFVVLSWMVPSALLVKNIVYEKEQRLKELMRIMGLGDSVHFLSWALISLVLNIVSVIVICAILKWARIMSGADFSLLLVFFFLFALSSIAQSLLVSTFFTNANIGKRSFHSIYLDLNGPTDINFVFVITTKHFQLLFPQSAVGFGMTMLATGDDEGNARWSTMDQLRLDDFNISLAGVMIALSVDTVLFCLLAWYISAVHPGVHGVSQPWYFLCMPSYWCKKEEQEWDDEIVAGESDTESDRMQHMPVDAQATITIHGLTKVYGNGMKAVRRVLAVFPSYHNDHYRDLRKELGAVRDTLGFCPQHNVLFDVLTVREQLYFYAALKGVPDKLVDKEVNYIINVNNLFKMRLDSSSPSPGGQKRRLCLGMALVGGSRFVILDEPTAGVDVNSRKGIWQLLEKHKKDRTILLSTHHMDEADVLSDRIAILSEGKLTAFGTSVFLKKRFGRHTTLTCIKKV